MKNRRREGQGDVALKIDISKAYDRVDWSYLKRILLKFGFSPQWVKWIMMCVVSVTYSVRVNEDLIGPITPQRGLRQGDPLSPYLFILCAEGLSATINSTCLNGNLHGNQVCRVAPPVSLLFADDSLLFCRATVAERGHLRSILDTYENVSGQAINYAKSGIYFCKNVREELRIELSAILGVNNSLNTGRYLGLPSLIGRKKKEIFNHIKERLWKKLQGWSEKKLSKAGKKVLIKAATQAIPSYCMTMFLLPSTLLDELHSMMNAFFWGSSRGVLDEMGKIVCEEGSVRASRSF